jgi:hypothetical protein
VNFEFANDRARSKIFQHVIGRVEFTQDGQSKNRARDEVIRREYDQKTLSEYKYRSISHVHTLPVLLSDEVEVLAHGVPVPNGLENCAMAGMSCSDGASDTECEVGKCVIGRLVNEERGKWRYESYTVPDLYYYLYGEEVVETLAVSRGVFQLPGADESVNVDKVASVYSTVYLPPSTYSGESFTRRVVKFLSPTSLQDSLDIFVRLILSSDILATVPLERKTYDRVFNSVTESLPSAWSEFIAAELDELWGDRENLTNREFVAESYNVLGLLYQKAIQFALSSFRLPAIAIDGQISRPVYNRLPGVSGAYNNEDSDSDVAKWLTSGSDMELSDSKTRIDWFYNNFLDPETCYPLNLDWTAQHMGFFGGMWNLEWDSPFKRLLLRNAHKNDLPEGGLWTRDSEEDTLRGIDLSQIEFACGNNTVSRYSKNLYNLDNSLVERVVVDELIADMSQWPGLIPARGSLLSVIFMFWAFNIKAVSAEEFAVNDDGSYSVRSGLRALESSSPVNLPVIWDVIHVGTDQDAEVGMYSNQLVADMAVCRDVNLANTVVIRMPFYYNRDGKTWDAAKSIIDNWMTATADKRLQYGYPVSDLLTADDFFFEISGGQIDTVIWYPDEITPQSIPPAGEFQNRFEGDGGESNLVDPYSITVVESANAMSGGLWSFNPDFCSPFSNEFCIEFFAYVGDVGEFENDLVIVVADNNLLSGWGILGDSLILNFEPFGEDQIIPLPWPRESLTHCSIQYYQGSLIIHLGGELIASVPYENKINDPIMAFGLFKLLLPEQQDVEVFLGQIRISSSAIYKDQESITIPGYPFFQE